MKQSLIIGLLVWGILLAGSALTPTGSRAEVSDNCPDGGVSLPVKLRDLQIGDCVAVEFPPAFSSFIIAQQNTNPPVLTKFFSSANAQRQRFDTQFEVNGFTPVPETGNIFINDFTQGIRYLISYLGPSPECTISVLTGPFVAPIIAGPGQFQGVFKYNGRRTAIFSTVTAGATINTLLRIRAGKVLQEPVEIFRRSSFALNVESFFNFEPREGPRDYTVPDFCPDPPP